jgi:methylthioribose-1-phosphate isomerase
MNYIESIKYSRGSLQLLDQRLLPFKEEYLDIYSCKDVHMRIREMAVRGAPAIAISGVLGLAVELCNNGSGEQFASAKNAADKIKEQLDYLVTRYAAFMLLEGQVHRFIKASMSSYRLQHTGSILILYLCVLRATSIIFIGFGTSS